MEIFRYTYEIILVDDHSDDNSVAVVESYIDQNPNKDIFLIKQSRIYGLGHNFVAGVLIGKGKFYKMVHVANIERKEAIRKYINHFGELAGYFNQRKVSYPQSG